MRMLLASLLALVVAGVSLRSSFAGDPVPSTPSPKPVRLLNEKCPLTGEEVNPEVTTVWNGFEVRFCCEGCIPDFRKDPSKYVEKLLSDVVAQRDALAKQVAQGGKAAPVAPAAPAAPQAPAAPAAPVAPQAPAAPPAPVVVAPALIDLGNATCPVMGRPTRAELFVEYHGMKVRLCCMGCAGKFKADPATYVTKLREDPVVAKRIDFAEKAYAEGSPAGR